MNNVQYYEKLQELLNNKGTIEQFTSLYKEHFDKAPSDELLAQYKTRLSGELVKDITSEEEEESYESSEEESYEDNEESEGDENDSSENLEAHPF